MKSICLHVLVTRIYTSLPIAREVFHSYTSESLLSQRPGRRRTLTLPAPSTYVVEIYLTLSLYLLRQLTLARLSCERVNGFLEYFDLRD